MRRLRFTLLPCVGDQETPAEGTMSDLVRAIPYLLVARILPPLAVLNEVLASGETDAGMSGGCRWTPLQINQAEWDELLSVLAADTEEPVQFVRPPDWVSDLEEWRYWTYEYCYGIPAAYNLRIGRQIARLEEEKAAADARGDEVRAVELLCQIQDIAMAHSDWVNQHRQPHIWDRKR